MGNFSKAPAWAMFILAGIVLAVSAGATYVTGYGVVDLTGLGVQDVGQKFLTITFVALFIERAVQVFVNFGHSGAEVNASDAVITARSAVSSAQLDADQKKSALTVATAGRDADAIKNAQEQHTQALTDLNNKKAALHAAKGPLREQKSKTATMAAVVLSAIAAFIGFRIFGQFIDGDIATAIPNEMHRNLFNTFDVVVTTLVLAGGADGLHQVVKPFLGRKDDLS